MSLSRARVCWPCCSQPWGSRPQPEPPPQLPLLSPPPQPPVFSLFSAHYPSYCRASPNALTPLTHTIGTAKYMDTMARSSPTQTGSHLSFPLQLISNPERPQEAHWKHKHFMGRPVSYSSGALTQRGVCPCALLHSLRDDSQISQ